MKHRMILPGFVDDALSCLQGQGLDPERLLLAAGLPARVDFPITVDAYARLWSVMTDAAQDEFFGQGARPMRPGSFTLMGHAVLHAGTLDRALRRALRFLNAVLDEPSGSLVVQGGEAQILLQDARPPRMAFAYRTYWLIVMGLASFLVGRQIPLRRVDFACPAPANRVDYREFFGAPVSFDQPAHRLIIDAELLRLPVARSEAELKAFLRRAPANLLVRYRHDGGLGGQVREVLRATPFSAWPDFDRLAAGLGLSPATLRRRLKAEGQNYLAIKDDLRQRHAQELLRGSDLNIAEIADRLGYSEPSAFHRAFLNWSDRTPGAYRAAFQPEGIADGTRKISAGR